MAPVAALDRIPAIVASDVAPRPIAVTRAWRRPSSGRRVTRAHARYAAVVAVLVLAVAELALRVGGSLPSLLAALVASAAWGFWLGFALSHRQARRDSQARVAAAAHEQRRRVVRDLHDGAQQRLVHTIIVLKLARRELGPKAGPAHTLMREALAEAQATLRELRDLASGISPAVLSLGGLRAGVRALAERAPMPVSVNVSVGRLPSAVEAAAYFVVAEALTNVAKHAHARTASVAAWLEDGVLHAEIRDDGLGGADPRGHGLAGLRGRVAELGGRLDVTSSATGTRLMAAIPLVH